MQQRKGDPHRGLVPLAVHLCHAICIYTCLHAPAHMHKCTRDASCVCPCGCGFRRRRRRMAAHGVAGLQQLPGECFGLGGARPRRRQKQRQQPARRADRMRVPAACVCMSE